MSAKPMNEPVNEQPLEQNGSQTFRSIAKLLNLSTLEAPPLRNWRTGDTVEEKFNYTRFWACIGMLAFAIGAIIAVCVWLWLASFTPLSLPGEGPGVRGFSIDLSD
jgi:hypothetical protein